MTDLLTRRPGDVPPAWGPAGRPAPQRPAVAVAAAVLGFQFAALYLLLALLTVLGLFVAGRPDGVAAQCWTVVAVVVLCGVSGLLLAGGIAAVRGTDGVMLLVATGVETAGVVAAGVWIAAHWPSAEDFPDLSGIADFPRLFAITAGVMFALVLGVLVLRLCLIAAPSVGGWLDAGLAPRTGRRSLIGVLVPVGLLAAVGVVAVFVAPVREPPDDASTTVAGAYRGESEWGVQFYAGGAALTPPVVGDPLYSAAADADAQACFGGAMSACDELFRTAPVGDVYEWFGSSCAGRLDHESEGGCVAELGELVTD